MSSGGRTTFELVAVVGAGGRDWPRRKMVVGLSFLGRDLGAGLSESGVFECGDFAACSF